MKVNYKKDDLWQTGEVEEGKDCLICDGGIIEKNPFKKEDKHPTYKCTNSDCKAGYWIPKVRQPAHQLKQTPSDSGLLIIVSQLAEEVREIKEMIKNALDEARKN